MSDLTGPTKASLSQPKDGGQGLGEDDQSEQRQRGWDREKEDIGDRPGRELGSQDESQWAVLPMPRSPVRKARRARGGAVHRQ